MKSAFWWGLISAMAISGTLWGASNPAPSASPTDKSGTGDAVAFNEETMSVTDNRPLPAPGESRLDRPLLEDLSRPSKKVMGSLPVELINANENAGRRLESRMPVEPWLGVLAKPPIVNVSSNLEKGNSVKEWRFSIMDDAGHMLWTQQKKGSLPVHLTWDGQVTQGGVIDVDRSFFYTVGAIDEGGNPIFFSGPPQILSAVAFPQGDRLLLRFLANAVFQPKLEGVFTENGTALMRAGLNEISQGHYRFFRITVYANNEKLADLQAAAVRRYYMREFTLPQDAFTLQHEIVNDRFKVEILCLP